MRNSITNKLAVGFGLGILLFISIVAFNYAALQNLGGYYDNCIKRSVDMELATDAQHIGEDLYLVIANAVINRDMAKTERDWTDVKNQGRVKLQLMAAAADTSEERAKVAEAQGAYNEIVHIYEQEMLPLIKNGSAVPGPLADIDAKIDKHIADIDRSLTWVAKSISDENQKSSNKFHTDLINIIRVGLTISFIGLAVALTISTLTTRKIVRPIAELTRASREMEKGNYLVELKHQSNDEIGVLAEAFRSMSEQVTKRTVELKSSNEQLQKAHDELDMKVQERTAELSHANELLLQETAMRREINEELMKSREELRHLAANLQSVKEEESANIVRDIHDDLGQTLTALKMNLLLVADDLQDISANEIAERLRSEAGIINSAIKTINNICTELRPSLLDHLGLGAAIEWQAEEFRARTGIQCAVTLPPNELIVKTNLATSLFRILQEALNNVLRHAKATEVKVSLTEQDKDIILEISDNGIGITEEELSKPSSFGLLGMRERVLSWQGDLRINGNKDKGTTVTVVVPTPLQESSTAPVY